MRWSSSLLALCVIGCRPAGEPVDEGTEGSSGTIAGGSGSSGAASSGAGSSGMAGSSSDDAADDESSGGVPMPDLPDDADGPFASGVFEIPAGTVVEAFSFTGEVSSVPGVLDGRTLLVAVRDLSHPERDQDALCPGSHPLDGCATVDYGAFGMTYDNRISFQGADGPLVVHLYKDRSLQPEPEPLPISE